MLERPHVVAVVAAALLTLATLSVLLPATLAAETGVRPTEAAPARETSAEPAPEANKKTQKAALEKLSLERLTLEKPAPEEATTESPAPENPVPKPPKEPASKKPALDKPEPAPEGNSDRKPDKRPERTGKASVASEPAPPAPPPAPPEPARKDRAERPPKTAAKPSLSGNQLLLSIPRLGLKNVVVGDSPQQSYLDREGIMHLSGTGFPSERGSNTYIAGHAEGYVSSRVPHVFRNLEDLQQGDHIILRDAAGKTYDYRVYERLVVTPYDTWVTRPVANKQIISLQTCFPAPTFDKRLVVRGELVG